MSKESVGNKSTDTQSLLEADAGLDQTVSEGSVVVLHGSGSLADTKLSYCWKQISGNKVNLDSDNKQNLQFRAPYIIDDENSGKVKISTTLRFQLIVSDDNSGNSSKPAYVNITVKRVQRAVIFQAGVALGAYEAGVFRALVNKLSEEHLKRGLENKRPLFDIVAGASIGALNAAVVVTNAIKSKSWKHSAEELVRFWKYQEYPSPTLAEFLDMNPLYHWWWDVVHTISKESKSSADTLMELISNVNPYFKNWYDLLMSSFSLESDFLKDFFIDGWYIPATGEAARRYYSSLQCKHGGAPHVASGIPPWSIFGKFFDFSDQSNFFPRNIRADNKHFVNYSLKRTLEIFAHFPIKTEKPDPRFLLVTVDVQTGDAVTFDSYSDQVKYHDEENLISYTDGIEIEHTLASGTFPDFFDYPKFKVIDSEMSLKNDRHYFWDGSLRSTTPLREVIQSHRDYWHEPRTDKDDVPNLEVYIADLWPSELKEEPTSFDLDFVENRKWNILFSDKTDYDEQVATVITDYNDFINEIKNLAEKKGVSKDQINGILEKYANSKNRNGQRRTYKDVVGGRFKLTKVVRIDRRDDGNEVHDKIFDYSSTTIEMLMEDGYRDALNQMGIQSMKDGITEISKMNGKNKNDKDIQKLERSLQQIQRSIRVENGNDAVIVNEVEDFISQVRSIPDVVENGSLKEEKVLLIDAAKQFQGMSEKKINLVPRNS